LSAKWQRVRIDIPSGYSKQEREAISIEVLDFIRDRSAKGLDKRNRSFPGYSESYKKSVEFKIAGKSASRVDLTLTGDTLAAMDKISDRRGTLLLGYENRTEDNAIADGNIRGTYGQPQPITGKKRDFLGITKKDLRKILRNFPLRNKRERLERAALVLEANRLGEGDLTAEELRILRDEE